MVPDYEKTGKESGEIDFAARIEALEESRKEKSGRVERVPKRISLVAGLAVMVVAFYYRFAGTGAEKVIFFYVMLAGGAATAFYALVVPGFGRALGVFLISVIYPGLTFLTGDIYLFFSMAMFVPFPLLFSSARAMSIFPSRREMVSVVRLMAVVGLASSVVNAVLFNQHFSVNVNPGSTASMLNVSFEVRSLLFYSYLALAAAHAAVLLLSFFGADDPLKLSRRINLLLGVTLLAVTAEFGTLHFLYGPEDAAVRDLFKMLPAGYAMMLLLFAGMNDFLGRVFFRSWSARVDVEIARMKKEMSPHNGDS